MPEEELKVDTKIRTPNQVINAARRELAYVQQDVRSLIATWVSDRSRAATDISVNSLMVAHLCITEAIKALNGAQSHTEE
jgi:hypothetical protein